MDGNSWLSYVIFFWGGGGVGGWGGNLLCVGAKKAGEFKSSATYFSRSSSQCPTFIMYDAEAPIEPTTASKFS